MKRPLTRTPIAEVQAIVGTHIEHVRDDPDRAQVWMSIAEYLKDARRWHYAKHNVLPALHPEALEKFVDQEIDK